MHRWLQLAAFPLAALLLLFSESNGAQEREHGPGDSSITVRFLDGQTGKPLQNLHVVFEAGYDGDGIRSGFWQEEALSNARGETTLPRILSALPWLQVSVLKHHVCQAGGDASSFSVERMRRDGLSAPNRCGTITAVETPGVFTVFVKMKAPKPGGGSTGGS